MANRPVVVAIERRVAPAVAPSDRTHGEPGRRTLAAISPPQHLAQAPGASGSCTVSLAFPGNNPAAAQRTAKPRPAEIDPPPAGGTAQASHHQPDFAARLHPLPFPARRVLWRSCQPSAPGGYFIARGSVTL